jgi:beta-lactamase regulating signal transducer with metallopeptidase domain
MIALALVPFALGLALWIGAPHLAARCRPRQAVVTLTVLALAVSLATGLILCVAACLAVAEIPAVGRLGHWSSSTLVAWMPVPTLLGIACGIAAAILLAAAARHLLRTMHHLQQAARTCRALGPGSAGLVVVDDARTGAYAVPGLRGRIVVTTSLLRALDPQERRAVLEHEQSHLGHRHVLYVQLVELAAAANPLLRPAARAVRTAVEEWADDDAVRGVGDRVVVARALAKASLASRPLRSPVGALAAVDSDLARRVRRLVETPRPRRTALPVTLMCLAAIVSATASLVVGGVAHQGFEHAQSHFGRTPSHMVAAVRLPR